MAAAFAMFAGIAYWYYKDTQEALKVYAQNQATLETALSTQKAATERLQSDIRRMGATLTKLNRDFEASRVIVSKIQNELDIRDIGKTAIVDPTAMEVELNKGTVEAFACIEILSGKTGDYSEAEYFNCTDGTTTNGLQ